MPKRMSRSRAKGTTWESAIVAYLQTMGWKHAERRALNGNKDRGDVAGVNGVCVEAKSVARMELSEWINEVRVEKANAKASVGVVWIRRRGKPNPGDAYVLMDGNQFVQLLKEAGYADARGTVPNQDRETRPR